MPRLKMTCSYLIILFWESGESDLFIYRPSLATAIRALPPEPPCNKKGPSRHPFISLGRIEALALWTCGP